MSLPLKSRHNESIYFHRVNKWSIRTNDFCAANPRTVVLVAVVVTAAAGLVVTSRQQRAAVKAQRPNIMILDVFCSSKCKKQRKRKTGRQRFDVKLR